MHTIEKLLLAPISGLNKLKFIECISSLNKNERKLFIQSILHNKISPIFIDYLNSKKLENYFTGNEFKELSDQTRRFQVQNLEIVKEVLNLNSLFKENELNPIYLKGVSMMNEFKDIALRPSYDIDILFKGDEVFKAYTVLKNNGFFEYRIEKNSYNELKDYAKKHHHLPELCSESNIIIELHHRITNVEDFNLCPLTDKVFANKKNINFYGSNIYVPHINDTIIHLIVHCSIQDFFEKSLRFFFDIKQIEKNHKINWNDIIQSSENIKIKKSILLSLGVLNLKVELTNNFNYLKKKYYKYFPDSEIVSYSFKRILAYDRLKIRGKGLMRLAKNNNYFNFIISVIKRTFLTKDEIAFNFKINKKNRAKVFYFSIVSFFSRLKFYLFSTVNLILNNGKISNDFKQIKNIHSWLN